MYLAKLKIENFRGIKSANFNLTKHTILLGHNNSGKSTIVDAIGLLLGKEALVHNLGDFDFYGGKPSPDDRIIIKGVITEFGTDNIQDFPEWFNDNNGGIPRWYNPENGEITNNQNEEESLKLALIIGFAARFEMEDLEFVTKRYFVNGNIDPFADENANRLNRHLTRELGFFLLPSKRNWERILSFGSEIFRKVIKFQNAIPSESICSIRDNLRENSDAITNESPFKEIIDRINTEMSHLTGKTASLSFVPTNADIESVLKSITPFLNGNNNSNIPLGSHGSGIISLQTLLLLLEFGRFRQSHDQNFIIAAEEPELHLHPGMHRRLVGRIRNLSTQTIITTHSPEIAAYYKPSEIKLVHTSVEGITNIQPLIDSDPPPQNALMKLFTVYRKETSEALMHYKTLIPEGISEYYWLNRLVNASVTTEGWDVENTIDSFGIIPTQDSNVVNTFKTLNHLSDTLFPFVDGDAAGTQYVRSLKQVDNKPKFVLQLPQNRFLEHLIAWILLPQNPEQALALKEILNNSEIDYFDIVEFGNLIENDFKTYWKAHDELIDFIINNSHCLQKVKSFIQAIDVVQIDAKDEELSVFWAKNEELSEDNFSVLTLNVF